MPILSNFPGGSGGDTKQATANVAGVAKLYTSTGSNTDGAMTQKAASEAFAAANDIPTKTSELENDSGFVDDTSILDVNGGEAGQVLVKTEDGAEFATIISYGTEDLEDGVSSLATGTLYVCYE